VVKTEGFLTWDENTSRNFIAKAADHTVFNLRYKEKHT